MSDELGQIQEQISIIDKLKENVPQHFDDVNYLSKAVVTVARWTYWHNTLVAKAELQERQAMLDAKKTSDKKISNDEAQAIAIVETENKYGRLKLDRESNEHFMNAMKLRIRVLMGEKETNKTEDRGY